MPDPKTPGSDKDLEFIPEQSFASAVDAKHAVALLPLLHFCAERPLERKLPDPFREMWLSMLASRGGAASASAPPAAAGKASVNPPSASAAAASPATAPASSATPSVVLASAAASTVVMPPPAPALSMARKFASVAEKQAHERERDRARAEAANKRRIKEEWENSQEGVINMSETNRSFVQSVLDAFFAANGAPNTASLTSLDADAVAACKAQLLAAGFVEHYCDAAIAAVGTSVDDGLDWLCAHVPESELPP